MEVLRSTGAMRARSQELAAAGRRLALVPTMGALHQGHLALVDAARAQADCVALSIFVNPAQFEDAADLAAYPRCESADLAACRARGVDIAWLPPAAELYPEGAQTWVEVRELQTPLCGRSRPGHFRGVATVVAKLLLAARPQIACFGQKDYQQLALVRRMVRDLHMGVSIIGVPTVREASGLALSSRNALLAKCARPQALSLSRALGAAERACARGEHGREALLHIARGPIAAAGAALDYAELRCPESLAPAPPVLCAPTLLALAAFFPAAAPAQRVRLIDNRILTPAPSARAGRED
ncbi:MAG: pantoate--beta-alanine ligase [Deltaproteobacteria bacterium]|nr:pantoate--beta-alanine ligase [Deltaproteobacteria bacterium]